MLARCVATGEQEPSARSFVRSCASWSPEVQDEIRPTVVAVAQDDYEDNHLDGDDFEESRTTQTTNQHTHTGKAVSRCLGQTLLPLASSSKSFT